MKYIKSYKIFDSYDEARESYSKIMDKVKSDIDYIKDILLELADMGYHTYIDFTPYTYSQMDSGDIKDIRFFIDINKAKDMYDFYGMLGERREIVDTIIEHVLSYLKEKGYKYVEEVTKPNGEIIANIKNPLDFEFMNNPTSYQLLFTIDDES